MLTQFRGKCSASSPRTYFLSRLRSLASVPWKEAAVAVPYHRRPAIAAVVVLLRRRPAVAVAAVHLRPPLASVALHFRSLWHAHEISRQQAKALRTTSLEVSRSALVPPHEDFGQRQLKQSPCP